METKQYMEAIAENSRLLAAAARQAGTEAPVPTCAGWKVIDLVGHIGNVHRWVGGLLETRAQEFPPPEPAQVDERDPVGWSEAGAERLLGLLSGVGEDDLIWNWAGGPAPATFWHRRMAHELVIHRADAESAAGIASAVEPPELAADGVDEYTSMIAFLPRWVEGVFDGLESTYHFHCTDTEGEWMVKFSGGQLEVTREHGKGDIAVRGPAGVLELVIYNRAPSDGLEIHGDAALLDTWRQRIRI